MLLCFYLHRSITIIERDIVLLVAFDYIWGNIWMLVFSTIILDPTWDAFSRNGRCVSSFLFRRIGLFHPLWTVDGSGRSRSCVVYCRTILFSSDCDWTDLMMLFILQLTIRDQRVFFFCHKCSQWPQFRIMISDKTSVKFEMSSSITLFYPTWPNFIYIYIPQKNKS